MNNSEGQNSAPQTVMVVDNLKDVRLMLGTWLTQQGYRVIEAGGGQEAIEVALREHPDLILMDIRMPVVDGVTAARSIREHAELRDVPIVAVTADPTEYYKSAARETGFSEYLVKPVEFQELREVVDRLLPKAGGAGA